jgi:hypothetical protein
MTWPRVLSTHSCVLGHLMLVQGGGLVPLGSLGGGGYGGEEGPYGSQPYGSQAGGLADMEEFEVRHKQHMSTQDTQHIRYMNWIESDMEEFEVRPNLLSNCCASMHEHVDATCVCGRSSASCDARMGAPGLTVPSGLQQGVSFSCAYLWTGRRQPGPD